MGRIAWNKGKKGLQVPWNKGITMSEESRKKSSEAHKGQIAWNKGIPMREESKIKLRGKNNPNYGKPSWNSGKHIQTNTGKTHFKKGQVPWNKGKKRPEISGEKHPMFGKHHSEESRRKISESKRGQVPWITGKHHTPESLLKMGKAHKGHIAWNKGISPREETRKKLSLFNLGKHLSDETKRKMRISFNKPEHIKILKERRAKMIFPVKDSKPEIKVQNFLKQLNFEFIPHKNMKEIEHSYQCDIFIPSINLVIECDGDYWHKYPIGREIDHIRTKELQEKGFRVLRLWESEIKKMNLKDFREKMI